MSIVLLLFISLVVVIFACFLLVVFRGAPYLPSHRSQVRRAFSELYPLGSKDTVLDLGSGDGTILAVAREYDAGAIGYEINPILWIQSKIRFRNTAKVTIELKDYNGVENLPSNVTVVYAFTTSRSIDTIGRKLQKWGKHNNFVFISYGFTLTDRTPDKTVGPMHLYHFSR